MRNLVLCSFLLFACDATSGDPNSPNPGTPLCADGSDECVCTSNDACGPRAVCSSTGSCACADGYDEIGDSCAWGGLVNETFEAGAEGWTLPARSGDAAGIIFQAESGDEAQPYANPGGVLLDDVGYASISQTMAMPPRDRADQFVAAVRYRTPDAMDPSGNTGFAFAVNGHWTYADAPLSPVDWQSVRFCLGEAAYGGEVTFELARSHKIGSVNHRLEIDFFRVELATESDGCLEPGVIANHDFAEDDGFEAVVGLANIASSLDGSGERVGYLGARECDQAAALENKVSIPLAEEGQGWALELSYSASAPDVLFSVGVGSRELANVYENVFGVGWRHAGQVSSSGNAERARFCIPRNYYGTVQPLGISLRGYFDGVCEQPERFVEVDDVALVPADECGDGDGAFEYPGNVDLASQWFMSAEFNGQVVIDQTSPRNGLRSIHANVPRAMGPAMNVCPVVAVETMLEVPNVPAGKRAAVRAYYKSANTSDGSAEMVVYAEGDTQPIKSGLNGAANYSAFTACLQSDISNRPTPVTFYFVRHGCSANATGPDAEFWVDDVEIKLVDSLQCGTIIHPGDNSTNIGGDAGTPGDQTGPGGGSFPL